MDVPDDLLLTLRELPEAFAQTARLAVAVHYLYEKRLSFGQAVRLAALTRLYFLDVLATHGIPAFNLTPADAVAEVAAARRPSAPDRLSCDPAAHRCAH
jgi:predicted HTH domain antitoxin